MLLILSLTLRPPTPLLSRAITGNAYMGLAAPVRAADLRGPRAAPRPLSARVRPTTRVVRPPPGPAPPVTETPSGELELLPGGATLETELPELTDLSPLRIVINRRFADDVAEGFSLYRSAPPQLRVLRLDQRPASLRPLYVSFATLQALDGISTWRAVTTGGARELNPALRGVADNLPALLVVKGVATVSTIYMTERLWKRNPTAAVLTIVGINAAYGFIVVRNFRVSAPDR
jgi:hypothetical protein